MLFIKISDSNGYGKYIPASSIKMLGDWAYGKEVTYIDVDGNVQTIKVDRFNFVEFGEE